SSGSRVRRAASSAGLTSRAVRTTPSGISRAGSGPSTSSTTTGWSTSSSSRFRLGARLQPGFFRQSESLRRRRPCSREIQRLVRRTLEHAGAGKLLVDVRDDSRQFVHRGLDRLDPVAGPRAARLPARRLAPSILARGAFRTILALTGEDE